MNITPTTATTTTALHELLQQHTTDTSKIMGGCGPTTTHHQYFVTILSNGKVADIETTESVYFLLFNEIGVTHKNQKHWLSNVDALRILNAQLRAEKIANVL